MCCTEDYMSDWIELDGMEISGREYISPVKKDHLLHFNTLQAVFFCLYGKALYLTRQVEEVL